MGDGDLGQFIDGLPKAELHVHVEGTLEPAPMFAMAARNGVRLAYDSVEDLRAAYRFADLQEFLDIYYQGASVLRTEQDFFDLAWAYLLKARADTVRHAEIFFDPDSHTARGVPFETVLDGLARACRRATAELGITTGLILCFLRHLDQQHAERTLDLALPHRDRIVAVGLDSSELGNPPAKFEATFRRARAAGFLTVAHAGEEGPAEYVREALDRLHVARIDHGNRALDDDALVRRLADAQIPLTLCPLSNLKLGLIDDLRRHPLKRMLAAGLLATINSDDPAYFGGYINQNYRAIATALDLTRDDLAALARNSFTAAFLDPAAKAALIAEVDAYIAGGGAAGPADC